MKSLYLMLTALLLAAGNSAGQKPLREPVPIEVLCAVKLIKGSPRVSPDGKLVALDIRNSRNLRPFADKESNYTATGIAQAAAGGEIWIVDLATRDIRKIIDGQSSNWGSAWSADGRSLAFYSDRDGAARLWMWDRATARARRVSDAIVRPTDGETEAPVWLPDGKRIFSKLHPAGMSVRDVYKASHYPEPPDTGETDELTVKAFSSSRPVTITPNRNWTLGDFGLIEVSSGKVHRFASRIHPWHYSLSPDGRFVAASMWDQVDADGIANGDFAVYAVADGAKRFTIEDITPIDAMIWSADGQMLAYAKPGPVEYPFHENSVRFEVLNLATFKAQGMKGTPEGEQWRQSGPDAALYEKLYAIAGMDKELGAVAPIPASQDYLYTVSDAGRFADVWIYRGASTQSTRLTQINPEWDRYEMGKSQLIEWRTAAGQALKGTLVLPADYEKGRRYPMAVWVYGNLPGEMFLNQTGVMASSSAQFNFQALATRGYAVFVPDAPQQVGTPMKDLAAAVLPGIDKIIEMGIADPQRLAVMGQSYGGYCVRALIVQTDRFKAAISSAGVGGNLFSMYGYGKVEDDGSFNTWWVEKGSALMQGNPWKEQQRYRDNSPFFLYDKVKTPILLQVGMNDTFVPDTDETYIAFSRLGIEAEYLRYAGEGHVLMGYRNNVDFWNRRIAFLEKHLATAPPEK